MVQTRSMLGVFEGRESEMGGSGGSGRRGSRPSYSKQSSLVEKGMVDADVGDYGRAIAEKYKDPSAAFVLLLVASAVCVMALTMLLLPPLSTVEIGGEKFVWRPHTAAHFKLDSNIMRAYRSEHKWRLTLGMSVIYIILQAFCVPGSGTTLNLLAGCLYHDVTPSGELLVALPWAVGCTTAGALLTYLISYSTARELVLRRFPEKVLWLQGAIESHSNAFFLLLSLRLSPVCPAWFLNIAAPFTSVTTAEFVFATVLGSLPGSLVAVKTGAALSNIMPGENVFKSSWQHIVLLMVLALVCLIPAILARSRKAAPSKIQAR